MKKLEIEKTKPTFNISTFKTDIIKVGLVFSISNFFIAKTSLANNWRSFSSSYLALAIFLCTCVSSKIIRHPKLYKKMLMHLNVYSFAYFDLKTYFFKKAKIYIFLSFLLINFISRTLHCNVQKIFSFFAHKT